MGKNNSISICPTLLRLCYWCWSFATLKPILCKRHCKMELRFRRELSFDHLTSCNVMKHNMLFLLASNLLALHLWDFIVIPLEQGFLSTVGQLQQSNMGSTSESPREDHTTSLHANVSSVELIDTRRRSSSAGAPTHNHTSFWSAEDIEDKHSIF